MLEILKEVLEEYCKRCYCHPYQYQDECRKTKHRCKYTLAKNELKEFEESIHEEKCVACNGSGWYDNRDKHGKPIKCGSCNGTGISR